MPKMTDETRTYIATRNHPQLGLLIKIGVSANPAKRCSALGARRVGPLLPRNCEASLKHRLWAYRAWPSEVYYLDRITAWPHPIFGASSEWFIATGEARQIVNDYVRQVAR